MQCQVLAQRDLITFLRRCHSWSDHKKFAFVTKRLATDGISFFFFFFSEGQDSAPWKERNVGKIHIPVEVSEHLLQNVLCFCTFREERERRKETKRKKSFCTYPSFQTILDFFFFITTAHVFCRMEVWEIKGFYRGMNEHWCQVGQQNKRIISTRAVNSWVRRTLHILWWY